MGRHAAARCGRTPPARLAVILILGLRSDLTRAPSRLSCIVDIHGSDQGSSWREEGSPAACSGGSAPRGWDPLRDFARLVLFLSRALGAVTALFFFLPTETELLLLLWSSVTITQLAACAALWPQLTYERV